MGSRQRAGDGPSVRRRAVAGAATSAHEPAIDWPISSCEAENLFTPQSVAVSPPQPGEVLTPFAGEAQCTEVGGDDLPVPFDFGWLFLDLNTVVVAAGPNPPLTRPQRRAG